MSEVTQPKQQKQPKQRVQRQQSARQTWASLDPLTLVAEAKQRVYAMSPSQRQPIEEVISRFEQMSRSTLGTGTFAQQHQQYAPQ